MSFPLTVPPPPPWVYLHQLCLESRVCPVVCAAEDILDTAHTSLTLMSSPLPVPPTHTPPRVYLHQLCLVSRVCPVVYAAVDILDTAHTSLTLMSSPLPVPHTRTPPQIYLHQLCLESRVCPVVYAAVDILDTAHTSLVLMSIPLLATRLASAPGGRECSSAPLVTSHLGIMDNHKIYPTLLARSFRRRFFAYHYAENHPHTNIILS